MGAAVRSDDIEARLDAAVMYAAMLGATLAGQLVGIAIDVLIGSRGIWIPAGCSVVLEAVAGARMGAWRATERPTLRRVARLSATYSVVLVLDDGACSRRGRHSRVGHRAARGAHDCFPNQKPGSA
jgi:hypothetical protein